MAEILQAPTATATQKPVKVGALIYTYDRVDDAKINMEIIRNTWPRVDLFKDIPIVHTFNGKQEWWPKTYLEDSLEVTENPGHLGGAELLLNKGVDVFSNKYPEVTHVIVLAADTWCANPEYLEQVIMSMYKNETYLATCVWGTLRRRNMFQQGMAMDFFAVDMDFVRRSGFFPLRYQKFVEKYAELLMYQGSLAFIESVFALRFKQAIIKTIPLPSENLIEKISLAHIHDLKERTPVHGYMFNGFKRPLTKRRMYWPEMGLITHHDAREKQKALAEYVASHEVVLGDEGTHFSTAQDLSYFNGGKAKNAFVKNNTVIDYRD